MILLIMPSILKPDFIVTFSFFPNVSDGLLIGGVVVCWKFQFSVFSDFSFILHQRFQIYVLEQYLLIYSTEV